MKEAIVNLKKAFQKNKRKYLKKVKKDRYFDKIRDDPQFQALMELFNLTEEG